ncbi:translation initiation factor IF-3 [Micrococcus sp. TA1]|uniref:translation initiation factor IF-3 n=2 Tax=Micrococcaceae TaxID=1268 RepID=UPI0017B677EA|nr:translation initiation factor IF-3 [Micrococcus sp. TA1]
MPEVRLVGPQGEQVGIVRIEDALRLATEADLDLVEVAPTAKPPVCKLMDFGKWKYEAAVKAREARKNQTNTVLKEVRFRLKIDTHDYETKVGHARKFLTAGDKVKAMIQFRGREQQRPELGIRLLEKFASDVADVGSVESTPRQDGRNMVMVVGPVKNKAEARAEARKSQQDTTKPERVGSRRDVAAREAKSKVAEDTSSAPLSSSMSDAMPEQLKKMAQAGSAAAAPAAAPAETTPVSAPAVTEEAKPVSAPAETKPAAAKPATASTETKPAAAKPATAPAETKPAAAKPATAPAETRPAAAKPAAAPAAKPAATPAAAKPAPKPSMPKPAPKPGAAPKPGPKPGGRK